MLLTIQVSALRCQHHFITNMQRIYICTLV